MIVEFYSCYACGHIDELELWKKNIQCPTCGSKRMTPTHLGFIKLVLYILLHPSYLLKAIKEK